MEISSILPVDVLEEILMRLPVKDLLLWKCVCKQWYNLIGDYIFKQKHYKFQHTKYITNYNDVPLFLDEPSEKVSGDSEICQEYPAQFYLLSKQGSDKNVLLNMTRDFERDMPPKLANNLNLHNPSLRCMGVVNGVVGIQWSQTQLALWNPATREFKDVAPWPIKSADYYSEEVELYGAEILGLGFNLEAHDFQILGLVDFHKETSIYEFYLYSLRNDSWKRLNGAPSPNVTFSLSEADTYLDNGIYYWFASERSSLCYAVIVSFNFATEKFEESRIPESILSCEKHVANEDNGNKWDYCKYIVVIGKYKQGLGLFINRTFENSNCGIEIWKTVNDEVVHPMCWELVVRVTQLQCYNGLYVSTSRVCGDLVLTIQYGNSAEEELCTLYDPSTQTYTNLGVRFCSCFTYVESLFSLS